MLDNYKVNEDGLIYQVEVITFTYDEQYVKQRYDTYGDLNTYMSYLRLGYIKSIIGEVDSILDVGYGNGSFLKLCEGNIPIRYGYDVTGYPLPDGVVFAENWTKGYYDVVTFFDVLEHFKDPYIIKNVSCKYIVISVPWCHYFSDEWFDKWKHRRPNEHLWFFNGKNINKFAESCGFKVIHSCSFEDIIRKNIDQDAPNILTFCLKNIK